LLEKDLDIYREKINTTYKSILDAASTIENVDIKYTDCPLMGNVKIEKTYGSLPSKVKNEYKKYSIIALALFTIPIIIVCVYSFVFQQLGIPLSFASSVIGAIFGAILASATALFISQK